MSAFLDDGRFRLLSAVNKGRYAILYALVEQDGSLPDAYTIAATLGVRLSEVDKTMAALEAVGLVVRDTMTLVIPPPLTSTQRSRRHRARCNAALPSVAQRCTALHDVASPEPQEKAPQTPKENIYPESKPRTPQPPTGEAGADGSLVAYPETAAALAAYPADLTQAQLLELTRLAAKRGDAVTAAITRASADRCRAPASDIRSPSGFLLYELRHRKEVPNARPKCPERYRNLIPDNERTDAPN